MSFKSSETRSLFGRGEIMRSEDGSELGQRGNNISDELCGPLSYTDVASLFSFCCLPVLQNTNDSL